MENANGFSTSEKILNLINTHQNYIEIVFFTYLADKPEVWHTLWGFGYSCISDDVTNDPMEGKLRIFSIYVWVRVYIGICIHILNKYIHLNVCSLCQEGHIRK